MIVVEDLPERQEILLACDDMKQFGLIPQDFPKPYVSANDTLHMSGGPRKTQRGGGTDLRRIFEIYTYIYASRLCSQVMFSDTDCPLGKL